MSADLVVLSLERAAARCDDLAPLVYERLFQESPESEGLFRKDSRLVRGEMLARAIEAILDLVGERAYAPFFIACEATTHAGYDVPPDLFLRFFRVVAASLRDLLGADWTPPMDAAWRKLIDEIEACAALPTDVELGA